MEEDILVSIIMNCRNGEEYLDKALRSVFQQTYKNWEIIFWDNNSIDGTSRIVNSYQCHKIKYFYNNSLDKIYKARNLALEKCSGDVITFLDCDDIWLEYKLQEQINFFKKGFKFIYGNYELIDENDKIYKKCENNPSGFITKKLIRKNSISIGCVMLERNLIFDNKFDPYFELLGDFDLWIRISRSTKALCINKILEYSRQHSNNFSKIKKKKMIKENRYFYRKFLRSNSFWHYPEIFIYILRCELKNFLFNIFSFYKKLLNIFKILKV